ncbi:hypothetical protein CRG98_030144 [Punica granatum]|uniref:DUF8040 domain-containing protein n=1 Tax=Punica granatum TaxID=22663 RepID=A0A2I0IZN9_PUNGR|nr:hypothetical protein CRG98_030144 [Punica granatum]
MGDGFQLSMIGFSSDTTPLIRYKTSLGCNLLQFVAEVLHLAPRKSSELYHPVETEDATRQTPPGCLVREGGAPRRALFSAEFADLSNGRRESQSKHCAVQKNRAYKTFRSKGYKHYDLQKQLFSSSVATGVLRTSLTNPPPTLEEERRESFTKNQQDTPPSAKKSKSVSSPEKPEKNSIEEALNELAKLESRIPQSLFVKAGKALLDPDSRRLFIMSRNGMSSSNDNNPGDNENERMQRMFYSLMMQYDQMEDPVPQNLPCRNSALQGRQYIVELLGSDVRCFESFRLEPHVFRNLCDTLRLRCGITDTRKGQYYVVDAGFSNIPRYLAPYKGERYHRSDFPHHYPPTSEKELFNQRHTLFMEYGDAWADYDEFRNPPQQHGIRVDVDMSSA